MSGFSTTHQITITVDDGNLTRYADEHLAMLWHVAQFNPVPHGDKEAGEVAERIGREIIRRWLTKTRPEVWHHQGRDHYWSELCRLAVFKDGEWVPRESDDPPAEDLAAVAELDVPRTGA